MAIEMSANELVYFCLGIGVEVLEFVHGLKFDDVETIGEDAVGFALEKMFAFVGRDVRNGGEYVGAVGCRAFDAVSVVDTAFASFMVNVKVLKVVVKVDGASTEISAQEGSMGSEDCCYIDMAFATERDGEAGLPFVKVGDNGGGELTGDVLDGKSREGKTGVGEVNSHRQGTMRRDSQRRLSRLSRGRWEGWGCPQGSRGRPSTRRDGSTCYWCRRGGPGGCPR